MNDPSTLETPVSQIGLRARVAEITRYFESISPETLTEIPRWYTANARFKDPFNDVRGIAAITQVFEHMFHNLHDPRFVVTRQIVDGPQAFLVWEFHFRFKRFNTVTEQVINGGTHLTLTPAGLISEHRDYWDVAEELYERLPVLGALMRWIKRRAVT